MKKNVIRKLDEIQEKLYAASDKIWNEPEIAFQEYKSMDVLCKLLEEEGFSIEKNLVEFLPLFGLLMDPENRKSPFWVNLMRWMG